jgi:hypothetical protein
MDTTTVLKIIEMLDTYIANYDKISYMDDDQFGAYWAYKSLRNELQQCIEGQLNAAENQTEQ